MWTSSQEGRIGAGDTVEWVPSLLGRQELARTAIDSDDDEAADGVTIEVAPCLQFVSGECGSQI